MAGYSHQLTKLSYCTKTGHFVLSWEMDDNGVDVLVHFGPRYYCVLHKVMREDCEFMYMQGEELIRWRPKFDNRKGKFYLELQRELEAHGLTFIPHQKADSFSPYRGRASCNSYQGNIGNLGFYEKYYRWSDWPCYYLHMYYVRGSHTFCGKKLSFIDVESADEPRYEKMNLVEESLEKGDYQTAEVEEFLHLFDNLEYDFIMKFVGEDWEIYASNKVLKINGKRVQPPKEQREDAFAWMIDPIMKFFMEESLTESE